MQAFDQLALLRTRMGTQQMRIVYCFNLLIELPMAALTAQRRPACYPRLQHV
jgi:hypothetical protein